MSDDRGEGAEDGWMERANHTFELFLGVGVVLVLVGVVLEGALSVGDVSVCVKEPAERSCVELELRTCRLF